MKTPSARLAHILIGKSIVETLVVGALAVFTFITVFPPYFHGWAELTESGISGWAVNSASPWERVEVQLFIDGTFVASAIADQPRPDVLAAGWAKDQWHGYNFRQPRQSPGYHEADIYVLHDSGSGKRKSLQLVGQRIVFVVNEDGTIEKLPSQKAE